MRIPGLKTVKRTSVWLKNRIFPGALILGYHRIATAENDSFNNCIPPSHFTQQMEVLRNYARPISMDVLTACLNNGEVPPQTICVTIDDGYSDTLYNALPVLEKYNIPATVFVTASNFGNEFWWDELERYIVTGSCKTGAINLLLGNRSFELDCTNSAISKSTFLIARYLRPLEYEERRKYILKIKEWAGNPQFQSEIHPRSMTPEELVLLAQNELIKVGSHTLTHPLLTELSQTKRQYEMKESKRVLEEIISRPVSGMSYPSGRFLPGDPSLAQESGYKFACTSSNGTVRKSSNRYTLPRFWIPDIDGDEFKRWLLNWL